MPPPKALFPETMPITQKATFSEAHNLLSGDLKFRLREAERVMILDRARPVVVPTGTPVKNAFDLGQSQQPHG
jgi:hypothetical protein